MSEKVHESVPQTIPSKRETPITYAAGRTIYDADSHVMETREWLDPYMDADLKEKIRPLPGTARRHH